MHTEATTPAGTTIAPPDPRRLLAAADHGAGYLAASQLPSGRFVHRRSARTGEAISTNDDLRRHFGALWAMLDVRGHLPAVQAAGARGVDWAIEQRYQLTGTGGAFGQDGWLVTGCSGLGLLAMDELAPEHAPAPADDIRPELVEFLLDQQITDGPLRADFPHQVAPQRLAVDLAAGDVAVRPRFAPFRSRHYTGEILFGLITYLDSRPHGLTDPGFARTYRAVARAMAALLDRGYGITQRSPWIMYAIRGMADLTDRVLAEVGQADAEPARAARADLLAWSGAIAADVLAEPVEARDDRAVPMANRVQTQSLFLDLLAACPQEAADRPDLDALAERAVRLVEQDCAALLALQDPATGGFLGWAGDDVLHLGGTQHAISALLLTATSLPGS